MSERTALVQCEVTGTWHHPDDVVVFLNKTVCAEGKERLLEAQKRVAPPARPVVAFPKPSVLDDQALLYPVGVAFIFGLQLVGLPNDMWHATWGGLLLPFDYFLLLFSLAVGHGFYHGWTRIQYSTSWGELGTHTRLVELDGSPITKTKAIAMGIVLWLWIWLASTLNIFVVCQSQFSEILSPTSIAFLFPLICALLSFPFFDPIVLYRQWQLAFVPFTPTNKASTTIGL